MLTAKQIDDLPLGFTPVPATGRNSISKKSTRYRHYNQQVSLVYQEINGKRILRLQPSPNVRELIKNNGGGFKGCKWRNKEQLKKSE